MEFLKNVARKILADESENYKPLVEDFQKRNIELRGELEKERQEHNKLVSELSEKIDKLCAEKKNAARLMSEFEKENKILRQYYDLDKEPSDEIKAKIHIDLEINRLKEENLKLIAMLKSQPVYVPQPYPYYGFGYRPF